MAPRPGGLRTAPAAPLAQRGLKNNHATLRAAGFGAPSGATVVWPQGRAICGLSPRHLGRKRSKKHSYNPAGCGIWRTLGGDFRLASKPSDLRIVSAVPLAQKALKNIHATLPAAGFNAPLGATVVWPQGWAICGLRPRRRGPKGAKKHSCNPAGCGIWRALGGDFRLASRPGELRAAPAAPLAQRGLKNIHAALRAAGFNVSLGATVVWPQSPAICGLRPRYLDRKGSKNIHATLRAAGFNVSSGSDFRLASRPGGLRTASAAPWPKGG